MQYSTLFLTAFAAAGAMAAPANHEARALQDTSLQITFEPGKTLQKKFFSSEQDFKFRLRLDAPVSQLNFTLGRGIRNQDVRCQVLDDNDKPVVMTRGENIDTTFSQGKPWTFVKPATLTRLLCGPSQLKTDQTTVKDIVVKLDAKPVEGEVSAQVVSETKFDEDKLPQEKVPDGIPKMYDEVKLTLNLGVKNRDLRCKALDKAKMPIIVKRGENIDFSFGDADKGPWSFINGPSEVSKIICDPSFKKADASDKVNQKLPASIEFGDVEEGDMEEEPVEIVN